MRRFLTVLILLMPSLALAGTCGNGYGFSAQIKLQKASGSDLTNFPYPLVGTYSVLKTAANGGQVQNTANNSISVSGPADLVFCDAASGGNALKYEVAQYSATAGTFEIWVQIPTLHTATNDFVYMFTNNSGVVTSQQDLSLWSDASYLSVYHVPDGSSLSWKDSAGGRNATNTGTTATTGKIDGGVALNGSSQRASSSLHTSATTNVSLEAWAKWGGTNQIGIIAYNGQSSTGWGLWQSNGSCTSGNFANIILDPGICSAAGNATLSVGWNFLVATRGATTWKMYGDGVVSPTTGTNSPVVPTGSFNIGSTSTPNTWWGGSLDEIRSASREETADWIATEYNTEVYPAFQILGETFATPTIVNISHCGSTSGAASCVMPFSVTSGGVMVLAMSTKNVICGAITDSLGLTYTLQASSHYVSVNFLDTCIYTAPITATGADTITSFSPVADGAWMVAFEVKSVTLAGVVSGGTNLAQPSSVTLTSPASNSFMLCGTSGVASTPTPSSFTLYKQLTPAATGVGQIGVLTTGTGLVASGSQSCSFDAGLGGTGIILGASAQTVKKRPAQIY